MQTERQISQAERAQILQAFEPDVSNTESSQKVPSKRRRKLEILITAATSILLAIVIFFATIFSTNSEQIIIQGRVQLSYGIYQANQLPSNISEYLGIRYAARPGRFAPPQPPEPFSGVEIADTFATACQGAGTLSASDPEDCLFADVYTPTSADPSSNLPVYVFTQGGGLTNATTHFNGTELVRVSGNSIIVVTFSYRVGPFGFLASSEIQAEGGLNLGHQDQHQLLQWVQKEIQQFGGDSSKVVLGGQSAGAESVLHQMLAYGGSNKDLFRGVILESASMPDIRNVSQQQYQYDSIVSNANCNGSDTLTCLRNLSAQDLVDAAVPIPYPGLNKNPVFQWGAVLDGAFLSEQPTTAILNNHFVRVPTIFGDVTNEGTIFTSKSISDASAARGFLKDNYPNITTSQLDTVSDLWGFDNTSSIYWKIAAQAYGDIRYTMPGIYMSTLVSTVKGTPDLSTQVWNWRYNVGSPKQADANGLGVQHGAELPAIWGGGASPALAQILYNTQGMENVVNPIQAYWISFIKNLDPNVEKDSSSLHWDYWTGQNRLLFNLNGTTMENIDDEQMARARFVAEISEDLGQ